MATAYAIAYDEFVAESKRRQCAYIAEEQARMLRALKHWNNYCKAMRRENLHALNADEINARIREVGAMADRVDETHGDTPGMRAVYDMRHPL